MAAPWRSGWHPDRFDQAVLLICGVQAIVLAVAMNHGWYYNDDFALMMQASGHSLDWAYLKSPINDHLLPGERLEFWILRHFLPLNYAATIGYRLVLQALGSYLLLRLLATLVGRRRRVLLVGLAYALCPLVVTNTLWLTVALALLPAQALVLGCLLCHLRSWATGRLRWAAASGLCLAGSALFWEKAAVSAVLLPVLALGFLYEGSLGGRVLRLLRWWRGWLLTLAPIAAFALYFTSQGYGGTTSKVPATDIANVLWLQWSRVLAPSLFGGPWQWFFFPGVSVGYAQSSTLVAVAVQFGFLLLVLLGVRLAGWRSLTAWLLPGLTLGIGTGIVALGRFKSFGVLIATTLRYGADLAVPLFLAVGLALVPSSAAAIRERLAADTVPQPDPPEHPLPAPQQPAPQQPAGRSRAGRRRPRSAGRRRAAVAVLTVAALGWLVGAGQGSAGFDRQWGANPTRAYVQNLTSGIDRAGPSLNLYDTTVSQQVLPIFFGPHWHLSDFLPLTGRHPTLDGPATEPMLVDDSGRLVPAVLVPAVTRGPPPGGLCTYLLQGAGRFTIPFGRPAPEGDGFLRIDYLQQRPSTAQVSILDTAGRVLRPVAGATVLFGDLLSHVTLRLPIASVAAVVFQTDSADTHLCIGRLTVGAPFPAGHPG